MDVLVTLTKALLDLISLHLSWLVAVLRNHQIYTLFEKYIHGTVPMYWFIYGPFTNLPFGPVPCIFDYKVILIILSFYYSTWCSLYLPDTNKSVHRYLARQMRLQGLGMVVQGLKGPTKHIWKSKIQDDTRSNFCWALRWVFPMSHTNIANHLQTMLSLFVGFPNWHDTRDWIKMPRQLWLKPHVQTNTNSGTTARFWQFLDLLRDEDSSREIQSIFLSFSPIGISCDGNFSRSKIRLLTKNA